MSVVSWLGGILFNGYQQWILAYRWPSGASHASKGSCLQATHPFFRHVHQHDLFHPHHSGLATLQAVGYKAGTVTLRGVKRTEVLNMPTDLAAGDGGHAVIARSAVIGIKSTAQYTFGHIMKRAFLVLSLALLGSSAVAATDVATTAPVNSATAATSVPSAAGSGTPLKVFNREIVVFRAPVAGVSPADRAQRSKNRINELLERLGPNQVTQVSHSLGMLVQIDGATAFVITPADIDPDKDGTLEAVAQQAATALETVVAESQESRNLHYMLSALGKALAASALLWVVVRLSVWLRSKVASGFASLTLKHAERVHLGGLRPLQNERVVTLGRLLLTGVHRIFLFLVLYNWLGYTLSCFPFTRAWGETLNAFLLASGAQVGGSVFRALPGLLTAMLIFWVTYWFNKSLSGFFERVDSGQVQLAWLDADVVAPTRRISKTLVWLFALAMAYPYLPGSETDAFKGLSVLAGLMISLGSSNLVGQASSGLILTYGRVFRKGEYVNIAGSEGTVTDIGMFSTRIRTGLGEELTIANSKILEFTTKNYSRTVKGAGFVLDTTVTIGYDTPWRQVHALLIEAAQRTEGVLAEPVPVVFQTALSDWYPQYRLVCQAEPSEPRPRALLLSTLHANIQDVFNEYGVQIMSPQYFQDPLQPKVVPPDQWYPAPVVRPKEGGSVNTAPLQQPHLAATTAAPRALQPQYGGQRPGSATPP